jgi:hypothetical protein
MYATLLRADAGTSLRCHDQPVAFNRYAQAELTASSTLPVNIRTSLLSDRHTA